MTELRPFIQRFALGAALTLWAALHVTLAPTQMRVAAGPPGSADVKFVEMLSHKFAVEHDRVQLHLVATDRITEDVIRLTYVPAAGE